MMDGNMGQVLGGELITVSTERKPRNLTIDIPLPSAKLPP
jgi:hypothetical protein